jgi:PAS domain S-box-containing protein
MIFSIRVVVSKEKANKTKKDNKTNNEKTTQKYSNIVLSVGNNEQITKYNKECEQVLSFTKKEVINQPIFDFLIPDKFVKKWKNKLNFSQINKKINDFELPLIDKQGNEIWISWSCFPVKNPEGSIISMNLVGKKVSTYWDDAQPVLELPIIESKEKPKKIPKEEIIKEKKSENFKELKKMIKNLKKNNSELDKKNKNLEKSLNTLKNQVEHLKKKKEKQKKSKKQTSEDQQLFSEITGSKKREQEYESMMKELDDREKYLNNLEENLNNDKIKINEQANEFKKWRKKLESLELEIENRKKEITSKEEYVKEKIEVTKDQKFEIKPKKKVVTYHDLLDKIPDSAAVIHRGILKQVNDSFAELIGYKVDEILNKSLFDFIIPEELTDVKDYYINRLMGVEVSAFETTLLTKDNDEILVEINTKPTDFQGKKAEIAIIKTIKSKKEEN